MTKTSDSLTEEDEALVSKAIDLIKSTNKASTSFLQRNFQIGYNKAARIMETLEKEEWFQNQTIQAKEKF